MNFYKHYIGDFQRDTGHLSLTERGAYLTLMHHYYATEMPLPNNVDALCRIAGAVTKIEQKAVVAVMSFFTPMESGLVHPRIEAELEKAGIRADTNRRIAMEREAKRRALRTEHEQSTNRATNDGTERSTNGEPIPDTRHQSKEKEEKHSSTGVDHGDLRFEDFWQSWPGTARKVAKAECRKKWRLRCLDANADQIIAQVKAMKHTKQWQDGFEPAPLTYLNQRRWQDDVPTEGTPQSALEYDV